MATDGRQTEQGGRESLADSNVVRLPRDWLGPREELIPFGSSAGAPEGGTGDEFGLPPSADAFWGESSSSLQDALQAPSADGDAAASPGLRDKGEHVPARARVSRAGAREALRGRARSISTLGAAAVAVAVMLALTLGATGAHKSGVGSMLASRTARPSAGSSAANSQASRAYGAEPLSQPLHGHARRAVLSTTQRSADRAARRQPSRMRHHATGRAGPSTGSVERVRYTSRAQPSKENYGASSSPPAPAAASAPTATVSGGAGGQLHSSGKQPALGANGALGPGSSPDG